MAAPGVVSAQEAIRQSLAGEQAAEARRKAATTTDYYNLKLGPTAWTFDAGLNLEVNDNVRYTSDALSDFIIRPDIGARMIWPLSDKNSLNLALGAGYAAYMQHSELAYFFVRPGSELSFDVYVGDFWINLHDRFSITQDNYQDPTVVGASNQSRLENSLGLTAVWDLNKVIVRSGYDHVSYISLGSQDPTLYQAPNAESEVFSASAGYLLRPEVQAGLELGTSLVHYDFSNQPNQPYSDAIQYNAGVFLDSKLSQYLQVRASVGYLVFAPDFFTQAQDSGDISGIYAQVDATHRLNQYLTQTLSAGRQVSFAYYGGTVDLYFARWSADWRFFQRTSIVPMLTYEHGTQHYTYAETFDRIGPGIGINHEFSKKLTGTLAYQYYWRGSDVASRDYTVNMVTLGVRYRF